MGNVVFLAISTPRGCGSFGLCTPPGAASASHYCGSRSVQINMPSFFSPLLLLNGFVVPALDRAPNLSPNAQPRQFQLPRNGRLLAEKRRGQKKQTCSSATTAVSLELYKTMRRKAMERGESGDHPRGRGGSTWTMLVLAAGMVPGGVREGSARLLLWKRRTPFVILR